MKKIGTVTRVWLPLTMALSLLAPAALGQITILSAVYGKNQTKAPGFAGATCYQRNPTILTSATNSYCNGNSAGDVCTYTVPWPTPDQDPGLGCYKNFTATYTCSGFKNPKSIEFGGITDEAANQVAYFNCAPMKAGSVSYKKDTNSQSLQSNGEVRTASYSITALTDDGTPFEGSINVSTRVSKASAWIQNLDRSTNYLNCGSSPSVVTNLDGSAGLVVEYQATGFSNVIYNSVDSTDKKVSTADVNFALKVNGTSCSGAFNYFESRQSPIEANFLLVVNNTEVPLNISFLAPQTATPDFRMVPMGTLLSRSNFIGAITGNKKGLFQYDFLYRNEYGLPAGVGVSCTFGKSAPVALTTDSVTGRLRINGNYTIAEAGRDSNGSMTWGVKTSLTGDNPAFILISQQDIGSVKCSPSGTTAAGYVQDLGNW